jgi:hypothetical protein
MEPPAATPPATDWRERVDAGEAKQFEAYANGIVELQRFHAARGGPLRRGAHAKTIAGLRAVFRVPDGLPAWARQGIFSSTGSHEAWVRLSNGYSGVESDWVPVPRGLAVKVMRTGVPTIAADPAGPDTQDFTAVNGGVRPRNADEVWMLVESARRRWLAPARVIARAGVTASLRLARDMVRLLRPVRSLALERYDSVVPIRFGPYAAKLAWIPVAGADRTPMRDWRWALRRDYLRLDLADRLRAGDVRFRLCAQFFADERRTPIEDASIVWPEDVSPLVEIAELTITRCDIDSDAGRDADAVVDSLSFNPWHCGEAHRPLGNIQRARRAVYESSARLRGAAT